MRSHGCAERVKLDGPFDAWMIHACVDGRRNGHGQMLTCLPRMSTGSLACTSNCLQTSWNEAWACRPGPHRIYESVKYNTCSSKVLF